MSNKKFKKGKQLLFTKKAVKKYFKDGGRVPFFKGAVVTVVGFESGELIVSGINETFNISLEVAKKLKRFKKNK